METLIFKLIGRLRPQIGWLQFTLGLAAVLCSAVAASDSKLNLPANNFAWTGLIGFVVGLWLWRANRPLEGDAAILGAGPALQPVPRGRAFRAFFRALRVLFAALIVLGIGALLLIVAAQTLPPFGLISQDLVALFGWALAVVRRAASWHAQPEVLTWAYLATSLPRFWSALLKAPSDGERGARLIVIVGGVASTWLGALALGRALAAGHSLFVWALPMLAAIGFVAILGAGNGVELIFGLALLLLLTIGVGARQRERSWDRKGADYSSELGIDALAWGGGIVALILMIAIVLPTSIDNPLVDLLWRDVEVPSGIAVLERNIQRPHTAPKIDTGLSNLPALELGQSLEGTPPGQVILKIRPSQPLKRGSWPRYWRARVLNLYNGRVWTTNARVSRFESLQLNAEALPGAIIQDVEDLRENRSLVIGLPDILGLSIDAQGERLPDGALVALTEGVEASRYQVLSRPQEFAAPPPVDGPPPDMSAYLGLPRNSSQRVLDLTRVIVGARSSPFDQALAIELYLRKLPYSYQVQPLPAGGEAVDQFLFDMRAGYCTYYASAMAVMARGLGIPARIAIGYATGEYDQASGAYSIHQSDAHAWPELYIDGRWLAFEPTPVRPLPARSQDEELPQPPVAPAPAEQARSNGPLIWAGVLAVIALLVVAGVWLGRPRRPRSLVTQVQARLERSGARAGVPWPSGATLHEYGALLAPQAGDDAAALREIVDLVEQARYSGQPLRGEQEGRLRAAAARVLARLARRRAPR